MNKALVGFYDGHVFVAMAFMCVNRHYEFPFYVVEAVLDSRGHTHA